MAGHVELKTGELDIWLLRQLRVRVTVAVEGEIVEPPSWDQVLVTVQAAAPPDDYPRDELGNPEPPYDLRWLAAHHIRHDSPPVPCDAQGVAVLEVPCVRYLLARASCPGWLADPVAFSAPTSLDATEFAVRVTLRRHPRVRGVVLGPDGRPVAGASVRTITYREYPSWKDDVQPIVQSLYVPGMAMGAHSRKDGSGVVCWASETKTDELGRFSADLRERGSTVVVVHGAGLTPARSLLDRVEADTEITVRPSAPAPGHSRIALTHAGRPIQSQDVGLADLTDPDRQGVLIHVRADEGGTIPSEWLVLGRWYVIGAQPRPKRQLYHLRWDGRATVELTEIDMDSETALYRR